MKNIIVILLLLCCDLVNAQDSINEARLQQEVNEACRICRVGQMTNNIDTIRSSIPHFEIYFRALQTRETQAAAEQAYNPMLVLGWLSTAYLIVNDPNIKSLSFFSRNYYQSHEDKYSFSDYYNIQEPFFKYCFHHQDILSLDSISSDLYSKAVASGEQSMLLAACQLMKGFAAGSHNDQASALSWMEKAYSTGKKYESQAKGSYIYQSFLEIIGMLVQGYMNKGNYPQALEKANELESRVKEVYGADSPQYLTVVGSKYDLLVLSGHLSELLPQLDLIDSVCNVVKNADPAQVAKVRDAVKTYRQNLQSQIGDKQADTIQLPLASVADEKILDALKQVEAQQNLTAAVYNQWVSNCFNQLVNSRKLELAKKVLDHANNFIKAKLSIDDNVTRIVEMLYGELANNIGDKKEALRHLSYAKLMFEHAGDYSFQYIQCLGNLVDTYYANGDLAYTKLFLDKINTEMKKFFAGVNWAENSFISNFTRFVASTYATLGYTDIAEKELEPMMAPDGLGGKGFEYDMARNLLTMLCISKGNFKRAISLCKKTVDISSTETDRRKAMMILTICKAMIKDGSNVLSYLRDLDDAIKKDITNVMRSFSPNEQQIYWGNQTSLLLGLNNVVLQAFPDTAAIRCMAYDNALYVNSMQDRYLHTSATWQDVREMLGDNEVAVEFVVVPTDSIDDRLTRYAALVLRKDFDNPRYVDLCWTDSIDRYFKTTIHTDTALINSLYAINDSRLYNMLWRKLRPLFRNGDKIYYSPVNFLCNINMEAISDGSNRLSNYYTLSQLFSTSMIEKVKNTPWKLKGETVAYGGLIYDENIEMMVEAAKPYANVASVNNETMRFLLNQSAEKRSAVGILEGTLEEAEYIEDLFIHKKLKVHTLTGVQGNEESVKALSGKAPQLLHIGTHGFILSTTNDVRNHRSIVEQIAMTDNGRKETSLLYTGLRMSGSDNAWLGKPIPDNVEDGILSAYEVSQLNLSGCELVVLSACETGLGFTNIYGHSDGLVTAFKLAGVNLVMASLWEVPDVATSVLMKSFYKALSEGSRPQSALEKARHDVEKIYPQPYYWAGFVLMN